MMALSAPWRLHAAAVIILELALGSGIHGYRSGAPTEQCDGMQPGHYGATYHDADGSEPFVIHVDRTDSTYSPGEEIDVEVKTKPDSPPRATFFKGFLLQARDTEGTRQGTFQLTGRDRDVLNLLDCPGTPGTVVTGTPGTPGTAVTHSENLADNTTVVRVTWRAPDRSVGNVTFLATVVQDMDTVFMGLASPLPLVFVEEESTPLPFTTKIQSTVTDEPEDENAAPCVSCVAFYCLLSALVCSISLVAPLEFII